MCERQLCVWPQARRDPRWVESSRALGRPELPPEPQAASPPSRHLLACPPLSLGVTSAPPSLPTAEWRWLILQSQAERVPRAGAFHTARVRRAGRR